MQYIKILSILLPAFHSSSKSSQLHMVIFYNLMSPTPAVPRHMGAVYYTLEPRLPALSCVAEENPLSSGSISMSRDHTSPVFSSAGSFLSLLSLFPEVSSMLKKGSLL